VITTSGEPRDHLLRQLIGAYIAGFTRVEVRFKQNEGPSVRRVVRDFSRMVIGPEILEETRTSIVLQDLSNPGELSAERCVRRMYLSVRSMHEDAMEVLRRRDAALAKDVAQRGEDIDRLHWMVEKQSSLAQLAGPSGAAEWRGTGIHNFRLVAKLLERIGDHTERIAAAAIGMRGDLGTRLLRDLNGASAAALEILDRAFKALMARDIEAANDAVDRTMGLERQADALTHRVAGHKGEDLLALGAIVDSIRRTGGYAADIAEIAINHVSSLEPRPGGEDINPQ
jgi:phosphate uptake regulator